MWKFILIHWKYNMNSWRGLRLEFEPGPWCYTAYHHEISFCYKAFRVRYDVPLLFLFVKWAIFYLPNHVWKPITLFWQLLHIYFFFFIQMHIKNVIICHVHHLTWNKVPSQRQSFGTNLDCIPCLNKPKMFCSADVQQ